MQNAVDIMAMVQKTNMVKQKFDVPSKTLGNEKASFRKELSQARKAVDKDKISSTKDAGVNPQRTTEKKAEKFAKVMSSNHIKADIKEESSVDALEQKDAAAENTVKAADTDQPEKLEENVTAEESIQSMLEMLQQMLQAMEGLKVDGTENQKIAEMQTELQALVQKLEQVLAVPLTSQTEETNKVFNSLKSDLTELVKQLEVVTDYKLDPKQTEQLMSQFTVKLNQAKTQLHQILQQVENPRDNEAAAQVLSKTVVKAGSSEPNKVEETKLTNENQQIATDTDKTADSKDSSSKNENNKENDGESSNYKESAYAEVKPTVQGDKLNQDAPKDFVVPQNDKLDVQLNIKQANVNLQKDNLVTISKTDIINQVIKKADIIVQGSHQEMIMKLEPESLGKLNLKLVVENGLITAKFVAESQQVKEVLESSFNQLKDALQEKGISVQGFSVSVGQEGAEFSSGQGFEQWKRTIKLNNRNSGEYIGLDDESSMSINPYSYHDGKVDYRA